MSQLDSSGLDSSEEMVARQVSGLLDLPEHAGEAVYLLKVANKGVFVILPVALQSLFRWKLFTA